MTIIFIDQDSKFIPHIINLGRKYSATLGFMPEGGFLDHARKNSIIIAYEDLELIGYLMFRVSSRYLRVTIVHLCIKENYRGMDISTKLLDALREKFIKTHSGIAVSCRADYIYATSVWQKYGFVFQKRERSRSIEEHYLNKWWYNFNQPDLFSCAYDISTKIKALLDSNIIFKLRDENDDSNNTTGVSLLLSDWLSDEVDYFYSPEIKNEILRDKKTTRHEKTMNFLVNFVEAYFDIEIAKNISKELLKILSGNSENDESDRKQLASCITSGIPYFITMDNGILSKSAEIEKEYDIQIFTPLNFILEIDHLINKELYSPRQMAGVTSHTIKKPSNNELDYCIDRFLLKSSSEKKISFRKLVNLVLTMEKSELKLVKCENIPVAFFSSITIDNTFLIPFVRLTDIENKQTLFMQILYELINESIENEIFKIILKDNYLLDYQKTILKYMGFMFVSGAWQKYSIQKMIESSRLNITDTEYLDKSLHEALYITDKDRKNTKLLELEKNLFPLKFTDLDIPCYIIPIIPYWAGQLFDKNISTPTLFGANPDKLWNIENVYYRHTKPINEIAPARILWYASKDDSTDRSQSIIATSYLIDVMTDKPKILFNKNKQYGIYEWINIYELCYKDIERPIRALRFNMTEVFEKPIKYKTIQEILVSNGRKRNTFSSPLKVDKCIYNKIYRMGICQK